MADESNDQPRERRHGRYPKEFRRDAAALVIDQQRTIAEVARELGVVEQTLGNWVRQERIDRGLREGTSSRRYNAVRLHSSLGYVPPIEWELNYRRQQMSQAA